jgi:carboxylesterase type B
VVRTSLGLLRGKLFTSKTGQRAVAFTRVPIAEGIPQRFRRALPKRPWRGEMDASGASPSCPVAAGEVQGSRVRMDPKSSEDCVYLKVWKQWRS